MIKCTTNLAIGAVLLTMAACSPRDDGLDEQASRAAVAHAQAAQTDVEQEELAAPHPPSAAEILRMVYALDSGSSASATADDGSIASYWFGHEFELGGRRYFTGFTSLTAEPEGPETSSNMMEPGHVAIGQATMAVGEDDLTWTTLSTDGYVGEFGQLDKPEAIDDSRRVTSDTTSDGRFVLAVPVRSFDRGVAYANYAVLVFNPKGIEGQPFRVWTYAGTLNAGSDNGAACEGGVLTCAKSEGSLTFEPDTSGKLPKIRVELSGNEVSGPGEVRTLGPNDTTILSYDESAERYVH